MFMLEITYKINISKICTCIKTDTFVWKCIVSFDSLNVYYVKVFVLLEHIRTFVHKIPIKLEVTPVSQYRLKQTSLLS